MVPVFDVLCHIITFLQIDLFLRQEFWIRFFTTKGVILMTKMYASYMEFKFIRDERVPILV